MSVQSLRLDLGVPRSDAAQELAKLVAARAQTADRADAIDREQREAVQLRDSASVAVAELERRAVASGERVSQAERAKAEKALSDARARADEPWTERRAGLAAAVADADAEIRRYIAANFDELTAELGEDGTAAAEAVDQALHALVAAFHERMAVEQRVLALCAMVRAPRPGDVARTRAESVVAAANALLESGGEAAPVLAVDPRQPRHGQAADVEHAVSA